MRIWLVILLLVEFRVEVAGRATWRGDGRGSRKGAVVWRVSEVE